MQETSINYEKCVNRAEMLIHQKEQAETYTEEDMGILEWELLENNTHRGITIFASYFGWPAFYYSLIMQHLKLTSTSNPNLK